MQHYQSGNLKESENLFRKALKQEPDNADVLYLLGIIYGQSGNHDRAIEHIKRSLQLDPGNADAYLALGITIRQKGLIDEAIGYFQKSISLNPDSAGAYANLGNAFQEKELFHEATACYQKAFEIDPNPANADILYHNMGMCFQAKGFIDEAVLSYQKAIRVNPESVAAYNNLGIVLQMNGRFDEADDCYQKALQIDPRSAETYYNLGNLLQRQGKQHEALDVYKAALTIRPDYITARWAKCISQLPVIYQDQADIMACRERYLEELTELNNSILLETPDEIKSAAGAVGSQQPFSLAYQGLNDRDLQHLYGALVCKIMSTAYPHFSSPPPMPPHIDGEPLRVGMISACFCSHPVWKTIIKGWVENLDRNKIHLFGYYTGKQKDKETALARQCFSRFTEDMYSFENLRKTIVNDKLHAIIYPEIGMDPVTVKLAALRLVPIQCASWGHPDTSGLPTIDYYLSSDLMEPHDGDETYTEQLVRLPNLSIHYTPRELPAADVNRDMFDLDPEAVLYHCCQTLYKFLPQYDEAFPRIAQRAGNCRFLFSSLPATRPVVEQFRRRIHKAFARFSLKADDYIVFIPHLDQVKYNALNRLSDIFLDPIGWSGCTSTLEAIDCDLPVVAFPGPFMRGRESAAILTMMGLKETVATSMDHYVELAVKLGTDTEWRRDVSRKIAQNKHIIYRDRTCITALEDFLEKAVKERLR